MGEAGEIEPTRGGIVRQFDVEVGIDEDVSGFQVAIGCVLLMKILRNEKNNSISLGTFTSISKRLQRAPTPTSKALSNFRIQKHLRPKEMGRRD